MKRLFEKTAVKKYTEAKSPKITGLGIYKMTSRNLMRTTCIMHW